MMTSAKEHGLTISLSTVATLIPVLTVIWFIIQPALLSSVTEAVAADIQIQVKAQTAPLHNAFKQLIMADINKLKRLIARLEYAQRHSTDWTAEDAETLADMHIELEALTEAYESL